MRKRFFLTGAVVCLLVSNFALAQSPATSAAESTEISSEATSSQTIAKSLSSDQIRATIAEAKQLLKSAPISTDGGTAVTVAALDSESSQIHLLSIAKDPFLKKGEDLLVRTQLGNSVRLRVINPNGVNTAVTVTDIASKRRFLPLIVKYPIEKNGAVTEMAYYTSAHPDLISPDVVSAGETYVTTMLDQAAKELAASSVNISPDVVNVAQHLVIVEHTDHKRFLTGDSSKIYPDVLALYALNQGETFKYSISSAGAGGMIQMIPRTYEAIRQHHPGISLEPDFVRGMSNHANALKAMLLYIDDTWRYLNQATEVQAALRSGAATKAELLAAGYNSNPYRLPTYLSNGGAQWRTLIPAETQMYLAIYKSVDSNVDFGSADVANVSVNGSPTSSSSSSTIVERTATALVSWIGRQLLADSSGLGHFLP